jgi:hypothetical protein
VVRKWLADRQNDAIDRSEFDLKNLSGELLPV